MFLSTSPNTILLQELQKQQLNSQFCDILLESDGISVPIHGCVLAAFSPELSRRLVPSTPPQGGQKLQLENIAASTLLKMVSLLYSGELLVKVGEEQDDVLAAAHILGVEGVDVRHEDNNNEKPQQKRQSTRISKKNPNQAEGSKNMHENVKMQDAEVQVERKETESKSTQTDTIAETDLGCPDFFYNQLGNQALSMGKFFEHTHPSNITLDTQLCLTPCPTIPSDAESTAGLLSGEKSNPAPCSASSGDAAFFSAGIEDVSSSLISYEGLFPLLSPTKDWPCAQTNLSLEQGDENLDNGGNSEPFKQVSRDWVTAAQKDSPVEMRCFKATSRGKNMGKMSEYKVENVKIARSPVKMKLMRRTPDEVWEIVDMNDKNESLSCFTPPKESQDSGCKDLQTNLLNIQTPPKTQNNQPVDETSLETSNPSTFDPLFSLYSSQNELESSIPSSPEGPVEETMDQIESWFDDVMNSLNIASNPDIDCEVSALNSLESQCLSNGLVSWDGIQESCGEAGSLFYQNFNTQRNQSSVDTGLPYSSGSELSYTNFSSDTSNVLLQQYNPFNSPTLCDPSPGTDWSFPLPPAAQKVSQSGCHGFSPTRDRTYLELQVLPQQSEHALLDNLPSEGDLSLPPLLSPLKQYNWETQVRLACKPKANSGRRPLRRPDRPWLSVTPFILEFPLVNSFPARPASPPQGESSANTSADYSNVKGRRVATDPPSFKKCDGNSSFKPGQTKKAPASPKQRKRKVGCVQQNADEIAQASKTSEVCEGKRTHCVVNLSCLNVLVTESGCASLEKTGKVKVSAVAEVASKKSAALENPSTEQTRIITRGYVKRFLENTASAVQENSETMPSPVSKAAKKSEEMGPVRKRGRVCKKKLEEKSPNSVSITAENISQQAESEQAEKVSPAAANDEKAKKCCRKRGKKDCGAEEAGPVKAEGNNNDKQKDIKPFKRSWRVSLKEFQSLLNQRQLKTMESKQCQESELEKDADGEEDREAFSVSATESDVDFAENTKTQNQKSRVTISHPAAAVKSGRAPKKPQTRGRKKNPQVPKSPNKGVSRAHRRSKAQLLTSRDDDVTHSKQENSPVVTGKLDPPGKQTDKLECNQVSEEDVEEVDVEVLSPGNNQLDIDEDILNNFPFVSDEEKDEEVLEIDVTGDDSE